MSPEEPTPTQQQAPAPVDASPPYATFEQPRAALAEPLEEEPWLPEAEELPRRPRRRLLAPLPLSLLAVLLLALGFIGGVLVEKGQGSSATSAGASSSGLGARLRGARGALGTGAGSSAATGSSRAGGGFVRPTVGTVAYLEGSTLYVTNSEGNTVKVTTSPATSVTKNVKGTVDAIHPGETVTITGASASGGAVSAEAITVGSSGGAFAGLFGGGSRRSSSAVPGGQSLFGSG